MAVDELDGSPEESASLWGFKAVRRMKTPWADRTSLLTDLLTFPGQVYPFSNEWGDAYCVDAQAFGRGKMGFPGGVPSYEYAEVVARYETPGLSGGSGGGNVAVAESIEPLTEFVTLPWEGFRWSSAAGKAISQDEAPGRLEVGFDWVYRRFNVLTVPLSVATLTGNVNNASMISATLGLTFGAETLLYRPPFIERVFLTGGSTAVNITYRFSFRVSGWNKYWRAETGQHERMYTADPGGSQYDNFPLGDLTVLLA